MEKNNLYVTNLCVGHKSIYYKTPELPSVDIWDDVDKLLKDKHTTTVNMEFTYVDSTGGEHFGSIIIKEIGDYNGPYMDDGFYEETMLTNENLIDLIDEGTNF